MPPRRLPMPEFVAMMAMMFALLAFSIDAMLPAFPAIAAELSPDDPNLAQLILLFFVLGMGAGTFVTGPLSDAYGRLPVIFAGVGLFVVGTLLAWVAPTLETVLAARALAGLGAAAPRVVSMALVRDLYEGRRMAQVTSFVMTVFMLVPAVAPSVGQIIIDGFGWRAIFPAFALFGLVAAAWLGLRQDETLPPERRRPFRLATLRAGLLEVIRHRLVMTYVLVLTLGFTQMFSLLISTQPIYDTTFGVAQTFPRWFMATAAIAALGTVANATLVVRLGMRRLATAAYAVQALLSGVLALGWVLGLIPEAAQFWAFFLWSVSIFFMAGLTFGNLNALALQPMGHIAGMAGSVVAAISTVGSAILSAPIGLAFDGTPRAVLAGAFVCSSLCWLLMRRSAGAAASP
jgi:DHA1 family bicyclomycin/chloramphenicol resistance-like MFS transporter